MKNISVKRLFTVLMVLIMLVTSWNIPSRTAYAVSKSIKSITLKIGSEKVTKKTFKMTKGKIKKLKVFVKPASSKKSVTYQSKNPKVVAISNKGKLQSKKVGVTKIIVKVKDKNGASKRTWVKIKVIKKKTAENENDSDIPKDDNNIIDTNNSIENDNTSSNNPNENISIGGSSASDGDSIDSSSSTEGNSSIDNNSSIEGSSTSDDNSNNGSDSTGGNKGSDIQYTVTFHSNGGSAVESQIVKAGEHAVKPVDPKKDNYIFGGWYTSNDYLQEFNFLDTGISKDMVLFARWVDNIDTAEKYSYEITPLIMPFNSYFYIKTDNPNPDSFRFIDETTKYADTNEKGNITPVDTVFADVQYENSETKRVKGGYIAKGSVTDGGVLKLQVVKVRGTYHEYYDTNVTVQIAEVMDVVDYLITTYGDNSKSYFDNLSRIENGFSKECLYSGVYVLGEQKKSTSAPYYGLSTSPHVDQTFYIQDPYYRTDNKSMFVSALYPMIYDSLGFPSIMMSVAQKLDSTATVNWSSSAHYLIDVTFNGETRSYGGEGSGGGQGINANQIKYWYSFDESIGDAYLKHSLKEISAMIQEYGAMDVPEEPKDLPKLTWSSVRQTVGKEGNYVKLILLTSVFGGSRIGYTFMYDDGSTDEGLQGWGAIGSFSNAWYDGRYFNNWEYYFPGAKFEETVKDMSPSIIIKDASIKLPNDDKTYYYNYNTLNETGIYNEETGVWNGFMIYRYDKDSQTWKNNLLDQVKYKDNYYYKEIDDPDFIDACTITLDEALKMNLDANTNIEPTSYYIYDAVTEAGTYHGGEN